MAARRLPGNRLTSVLLVTPAYRRYDLTALMLEQRRATFAEARKLGVECECVVIADDANLDIARGLGFATVEAPNVLGRKYNDGHEYAVREGFDFSFHVNSDQVFDPRLLGLLADAPRRRLLATHWMTAVSRSGRRAITYQNPVWAMRIYPVEALRNAPRPCAEDIGRMCDTSTHEGVAAANPGMAMAFVEAGPLETIQFESRIQLTPWSRHQKLALMDGTWQGAVPWDAIAEIHGQTFVRRVQQFYGQGDRHGRS